MNLIILNNVNGIPIVPTGLGDFTPASAGNYVVPPSGVSIAKDPLLSNEVTVMTVPVVE